MSKVITIQSINARTVWSSTGVPTIEVDVILSNSIKSSSIMYIGLSKGSKENTLGRSSIKDLDKLKFLVKQNISLALSGFNILNQEAIDKCLWENFQDVPTNLLATISIASIKAAACYKNMPLWEYLSNKKLQYLPLPEIRLISGGSHADQRMDWQDIMLIPHGAKTFSQGIEWIANIFEIFGSLLQQNGREANYAVTGSYWPHFQNHEEALKFTTQAIKLANLEPGLHVGISIDIAASQLVRKNLYELKLEKKTFSSEDLIDYYLNLVSKYPIISIEDPFGENDYEAYIKFKKLLPKIVQLIADDFCATDPKYITDVQKNNVFTGILLKPSQAGTLSRCYEAYTLNLKKEWDSILSGRSGENEDITLMDIAIGWQIPQVKIGGFRGSECIGKYNQALRVSEIIGDELPPTNMFTWGK